MGVIQQRSAGEIVVTNPAAEQEIITFISETRQLERTELEPIRAGALLRRLAGNLGWSGVMIALWTPCHYYFFPRLLAEPQLKPAARALWAGIALGADVVAAGFVGYLLLLVLNEALGVAEENKLRKTARAARPHFVRAVELTIPAQVVLARATAAADTITGSAALAHGLIEESTAERLAGRVWSIAQTLARHSRLTQAQEATTSLAEASQLRSGAGLMMQLAEEQVEKLETYMADVLELDANHKVWSQKQAAAAADATAQQDRTVAENWFRLAVESARRSGAEALPPAGAADH